MMICIRSVRAGDSMSCVWPADSHHYVIFASEVRNYISLALAAILTTDQHIDAPDIRRSEQMQAGGDAD
ncbi:hypothetical protein WS62_31260 [Burkholderia sp. ABCPW 14]|nr:hypothetical protein WS62_31260 [Burkholderia sp. ABCPW 14]